MKKLRDFDLLADGEREAIWKSIHDNLKAKSVDFVFHAPRAGTWRVQIDLTDGRWKVSRVGEGAPDAKG